MQSPSRSGESSVSASFISSCLPVLTWRVVYFHNLAGCPVRCGPAARPGDRPTAARGGPGPWRGVFLREGGPGCSGALQYLMDVLSKPPYSR